MAEPTYKVETLISYLVQLGVEPENGGENAKWHLDMGRNGSEPSLRLNISRGRYPGAIDIAETLDSAGIKAEAAVGESGPYVTIRKSNFGTLNPANFGPAKYALETLFSMETAGGKPGQYVSIDEDPTIVDVSIAPALIQLAGLGIQSSASFWETGNAANGDPSWNMDFPAKDRGRVVSLNNALRGAGVMSEVEKKPDGGFSLLIRQSNAETINDVSIGMAKKAVAPYAASPAVAVSRQDVSTPTTAKSAPKTPA